jgi:hypothetical protein
VGAYLQRSRHGTIYYFRRKLPIDLRQHAKVPQFYLSLGTADRTTALILARRAATLSDEIFASYKLMATKKPNADLMRLIEDRKLTAPLKEEIERLRDEILESHFQRNKAVRQLKVEHVEQLAAITKATASTPPTAGAASPGGRMTVGEAIKKYLEKRMKPESRKRIVPALKYFEDFAGATTPLNQITQARFADLALASVVTALNQLYAAISAYIYKITYVESQ